MTHSLNPFSHYIIILVLYTSPPRNYFLKFVSLAPVSDLNILKARKRLRSPISVGVDDIPSFGFKGGCELFVPLGFGEGYGLLDCNAV
jgi:hypothetical protein